MEVRIRFFNVLRTRKKTEKRENGKTENKNGSLNSVFLCRRKTVVTRVQAFLRFQNIPFFQPFLVDSRLSLGILESTGRCFGCLFKNCWKKWRSIRYLATLFLKRRGHQPLALQATLRISSLIYQTPSLTKIRMARITSSLRAKIMTKKWKLMLANMSADATHRFQSF